MRYLFARLLVALAAAAVAAGAAAGGAWGFGTMNGGLTGQHAEHEQITRAALWCKATGHPEACFDDRSMFDLAGGSGIPGAAQGAVGQPDVPLLGDVSNPAAHCDNADYTDLVSYSRTRQQATQALLNCRAYALSHLRAAVSEAGKMIDKHGHLVRSQVEPEDITSDGHCIASSPIEAKCKVIGAFGHTLHTTEDFYSHTNWAGAADPHRPLGISNPPGLGRSDLTSLFDYDAPPVIPKELSGGCFDSTLLHPVSGTGGECKHRITHDTMNKDEGIINPRTGAATHPDTSRGQIGHNFANAVSDAILEATRQWQLFQADLIDRYGGDRAKLLICAITRDDAYHTCQLKLTITGTEQVHWTADDTTTNACDPPHTVGSGTTTIRFESTHPVYASPLQLLPPLHANAPPNKVRLPVRAHFKSHGSESYPQGFRGCGGCGAGPGCGRAPQPDCGDKTAALALAVTPRQRYFLTLENNRNPRDPYHDCASGIRARGTVGPSDGELDQQKLFDSRVGKFTVEGWRNHHRSVTYGGFGESGTDTVTVTLKWTLTLEHKQDDR